MPGMRSLPGGATVLADRPLQEGETAGALSTAGPVARGVPGPRGAPGDPFRRLGDRRGRLSLSTRVLPPGVPAASGERVAQVRLLAA